MAEMSFLRAGVAEPLRAVMAEVDRNAHENAAKRRRISLPCRQGGRRSSASAAAAQRSSVKLVVAGERLRRPSVELVYQHAGREHAGREHAGREYAGRDDVAAERGAATELVHQVASERVRRSPP